MVSKNLSAIEVILLLFYYYRELDEDLAYIHCRSIGRSREENMGSKGPGSLMYMNVAGGSWRKVIFKNKWAEGVERMERKRSRREVCSRG